MGKQLILSLWCLLCLQTVVLRADDAGQVQTELSPTLRLMPADSFAVFHCRQPLRVVEQLLTYSRQLQLTQFDEVKELLSSTTYQRFDAFIKYMETLYGRPWDKLLHELTGEGVSIALVAGQGEMKKPQVLAVIAAHKAELLKTVYQAGLELLKQDQQQNDAPTIIKTKAYRDINITSVGDQFFLAMHGSTLMLATKAELLTKAIDQLLDSGKTNISSNPRFIAAEQPRSASVLAWGWLDVNYFKDQIKNELEMFKLPTNDLPQFLVVGGLFDAVLRSDHAWITISAEDQGPVISLSSPAGRDKAQYGASLLHMHDPNKESLLPLLNPPRTLASMSFYWNLAEMWKQREKIFKEGALKDFEEGGKQVKPFLAGNTLGSLLTTLGGRHRIVVASQHNSGYQIKPKVPYPAFAFVADCQDADRFSKMIAVPLRTAGFFLSTQVSLKLFEETHQDIKITGYRFLENDKNRAYDQNTLFNYSPSFARVGNCFVISSTVELCKDLIDEIKRTGAADQLPDHADMRQRFSWTALGQAFAVERQRLSTELTLRHGGAAEKVDSQIDALLKLLDRLGTLDFVIEHSPGFKMELRARYR